MASTPRGKVNLACDRCRQRKSRCDGLRPVCSHCRQAGRECTYRPTPTSLESDAAVLSRLGDLESRVHVLEERDRSVAADLHLPGISSTLAVHHPPTLPAPPPPLLPQTALAVADLPSFVSPPDLHTASGCSMLHCWPRIRLSLTVPHLRSRTYLAECDQADPLLLLDGAEGAAGDNASAACPPLLAWQVSDALEAFYSPAVLPMLPTCLLELLEHYPGLHREQILGSFARLLLPLQPSPLQPSPLQPSPPPTDSAVVVNLAGLSFPQLLVLSMTLRVVNVPDGLLSGCLAPASVMALATKCCSLALQKLWMLRSGPDDDLVPLVLAMAYYLAYFWVRPFHALGLLQSIDPAIKHMAVQQHGNPRVPCYARLHFILESDILTELDGIPSSSSRAILAALPADSPALEPPGRTTAPSPPDGMASPTTPTPADGSVDHHHHHPLVDVYIANHVRLRTVMNRILHLLYTPTKAYAQPHELADLVCSLSAGLRDWYQSQPRDQQFVRDATIFSMNVPSMPLGLREVALRYFACVFLLHRPVLYFFLHKDMEYTVRPPDTRTLHVDREPWVLESCRDCIESAALIIYFSCMATSEGGSGSSNGGSNGNGHAHGHGHDHVSASAAVEATYQSWCGTQLLFAAYLVLLQVRPVTSLVPVFRNIGDIDVLLDRVEQMLVASPVASLQIEKSLAVLQDERRNFEAASPMGGIPGMGY